MTDIAAIAPQPHTPQRLPIFLSLAASVALAAIATIACYHAAGPTLGLFFGGFFVGTLITPAAVLSQRTLLWRLAAIASVTAAIAAVWLIPIFKTPDTITQWLELSAVLLTYIAMIAAITLFLPLIRLAPPLAAAKATLFGLAWLTWPIWLCTILANSPDTRITGFLTSVHPPLVANGILTNEPPWTEKILAYSLTNLNQDIPIQLPPSPLRCILFHGLIATALLSFTTLRKKVP